MPVVLPLLGPDGDSLPARPEHLSEHSSGGQQAPVLFREQRPAPKRRYSKTRKGSPKDINRLNQASGNLKINTRNSKTSEQQITDPNMKTVRSELRYAKLSERVYSTKKE